MDSPGMSFSTGLWMLQGMKMKTNNKNIFLLQGILNEITNFLQHECIEIFSNQVELHLEIFKNS